MKYAFLRRTFLSPPCKEIKFHLYVIPATRVIPALRVIPAKAGIQKVAVPRYLPRFIKQIHKFLSK